MLDSRRPYAVGSLSLVDWVYSRLRGGLFISWRTDMSQQSRYTISLHNHAEVVEEATGAGATPRHALLTATLERHPEAANQWRYEDDADGSGSLVCPDDAELFYLADPVLDGDEEGEATGIFRSENTSGYTPAELAALNAESRARAATENLEPEISGGSRRFPPHPRNFRPSPSRRGR